MSEPKNLTEQVIEAAAMESAANFGPAERIFHPDYGWILWDGEITEAGKQFAKDHLENK